MSIQTVFEHDTTLLTHKAGEFLETACNTKEVPLLLLLSGGSALHILNNVTFTHGSNITVLMLDERYSNDSLNNNFLQLQKNPFYGKAVQAGVTFINTSFAEGQQLEDLVFIMDNAIRTWKEKHTDGSIIAVMGSGVDGHTAGIMPYPEDPAHFKELFDREETFVVGYNAKEKNAIPHRVTTTLSFLRKHVDEAILYITGEQKKPVLKKVLSYYSNMSETPLLITKEMKSVTLFTDIAL